tara:strand:- start:427 stop:627 length:201 start_codon:yes stop_codon:yes gene_type:complete
LSSPEVVALSNSNTQSIREAFSNGTLIATPLNFPSNLGYICVIAEADPVVVGISELIPERARLKSS